ncbi:uncharacterized protein MEPE_04668 [Melanopsichium pennsylvanicum]|uniref:Uncharacterized protein n=2 Tax=Melanopsichium pennsylvanicum TaxID=63383 RepID=A0AAJ4XN48_9BASI|nr:conserved hypothetical protein [Melanopsichium pennsylvanicum 4]SNX85959.1 uncharacterized protein MEPE_04668 [Melanopsichium pennsylvanicum]
MPASTENGHSLTLSDVPSFISARSANTLISENRPTRIQAGTLLVLNGLLDELLLVILSSARSLATDRIKSDGMLRAFNNNLLAKDAVLEAELELRSYLDGRRAEGAKVPLGLMATSRVDGTDSFPVQSAYKALRTRCQYYSTLGDCDDDSAAKDQNIMSSDGRPIATVTPPVAIYVTALLEFVGQHILQNVARVIERDNSDEASLYDLRAAITEDEHLNPLYNKLSISQEISRRIEILEARRRKITEDGASRGLRSDARVVKPWHVPTEGDFDEAAGPALFSSKRASIQQQPRSDNGVSSASSSSRYGHATSSSTEHADSLRASRSTLRTWSSVANHDLDANEAASPGNSIAKQNSTQSSMGLGTTGARPDGSASNIVSIGRRQSSDRSWSGVFSGIKRRNSFKQGSDSINTSARLLSPTTIGATSANQADSALDPDDDFEALMLSGQTMKVSLTPNRLHTIEVAKKGGDSVTDLSSARRRPGTAGVRDDVATAAAAYVRGPSPSPTSGSQGPAGGEGLASNIGSTERTSSSSTTPSDAAFPRPSSRASLQTAMRPERRAKAPPPSSYRSPSPALIGNHNLLTRNTVQEDTTMAVPPVKTTRRQTPRLQPRDDEAERSSSTAKDLVDLFKSTPPSATQERLSNVGSDTSSITEYTNKKTAMSDRVRTLFGRKSSSSTGHHSPSSPNSKAFRMPQHADTKASLESSQDTYITSSTTNSTEQTRSLVSPNNMLSNRQAASRSSTSTSEHPLPSADATMEVKPTPDVTVIESEPISERETNGLGIGVAAVAGMAGAASPMAAVRSASHGSRSTSHASQTHSTADVTTQDDSLTDDASSASKPKTADELVSRKVPWGYKRNSASASTMGERNGTPTSDRRRSVGYQSSNGHSVLPVRGHFNGPSSENGHGATTTASALLTTTAADETDASLLSASSTSRSAKAPTAWSGASGASGSHTMVRRGSSGARPISANQARRPIGHLETIQLLAELERAMRQCHTVDECRELVQKAMHSDAAPFTCSESRGSGITDDNAAQSAVGKDDKPPSKTGVAAAEGALAGAAAVEHAIILASSGSRVEKGSCVTGSEVRDSPTRGTELRPGMTLVKPPIEDQATSLETVEQGMVVAWLLGGDEGPLAHHDGLTDKLDQTALPVAAEVSGADSGEAAGRSGSWDSHVSRGDICGFASSSVVSLQSNYKDAQDDVTVN